MKSRNILYTIFCLSILFLSVNAFAADYYVSTTGNDNNPGTQSAPWRTIQKAASQLTAGDTAYIQDGTYAGTLTPQRSGQAGAWIRFIGQGDNVNITQPTSSGRAIEISGKSYISVSNLKLQQGDFYVYNSAYIVADHILLSGFGGMWAGRSNNITFENAEVIGNYAAFPNGRPQTGISFGEGVSSSVIRGNIVRGVGNGIQVTANPSAPISGITIEDNVYYDNSAHAMYIGRYVSNVIVRRNRARNGYEGIYLAGVENAEVYNNTYYFGPVWVLVDELYNRPCRNVRLRNNIIVSGDNDPWTDDGYFIAVDAVSVAGGYSSDYNLFYKAPGAPTPGWVQYNGVAYASHAEYQSVSSQDLHTVVANPLFLNEAGHDFHLQETSPAINAGDPGFGINFPGAQIDIGAFEYTGEEPLENQPPVIAIISNQIARVNKNFSSNISATDVDGDCVTFSALVKPAWLTLINNGCGSATLSGKPTKLDLGNNLVRIEATDGLETVTAEFTIKVVVRSMGIEVISEPIPEPTGGDNAPKVRRIFR